MLPRMATVGSCFLRLPPPAWTGLPGLIIESTIAALPGLSASVARARRLVGGSSQRPGPGRAGPAAASFSS